MPNALSLVYAAVALRKYNSNPPMLSALDVCCSPQVDDVRNAVRERFSLKGDAWLSDVRVESPDRVTVVVASRDALPVDGLFQTTQKAGSADELHEFWTWNTEKTASEHTEPSLQGLSEVRALCYKVFEGFRFQFSSMPRAFR